MGDLISRKAAIDVLGVGKKVLSRVLDDTDDVVGCEREKYSWGLGLIEAYINDMKELPPAQPEIVRCCKCSYWDRDSLRHQYNDFRDWNEAECKMLAERDPYDEINRYTEADDYCSRAERRQE